MCQNQTYVLRNAVTTSSLVEEFRNDCLESRGETKSLLDLLYPKGKRDDRVKV